MDDMKNNDLIKDDLEILTKEKIEDILASALKRDAKQTIALCNTALTYMKELKKYEHKDVS